jgi:hypothetical protein
LIEPDISRFTVSNEATRVHNLKRTSMLTAAALGMFGYGSYSVGWAVADLIRGPRLELWADLGLMAFGVLLILAAAFVRVKLPGGLAFAIGAMLGLQALAVHAAVRLGGGIAPQLARASIAIVLVAIALSDARPSPARPGHESGRGST